MPADDGNPSSICHDCIGDEFLAAEVREQGSPSRCKYCGQTREALPLGMLAHRVHEVLEEYFELMPSQPTDGYGMFLQRQGLWPPDGDPVVTVIRDITRLSKEIAEDVRGLLHQSHDQPWDKDSLDADNAYDSESLYTEREPDDSPFRFLWTQFQHEIRSISRFFSVRAERLLASIFEDLPAHEAFDDRPVISKIGPDDADPYVWRARVAQSREQLKTILESPSQEIGPPPSRWEKDGRIRPPGGRMNAPGIPVFYGARDMDTCVTEVRPPVGSHVVAAKFELLRTLRLLDLDALEWIYVREGYFDPEFAERRSKALFLQWLAREIGRPVMPQDETTEYLATQAMAEYLANKEDLRLDGIIFRSSQTRGIGRNLVLFTHARRVQRCILPPGTTVSKRIPSSGFGKGYPDNHADIFVHERVPADPPLAEVSPIAKVGEHGIALNLTNDNSAEAGNEGQQDNDVWSYGEPTLRLDLESVVVLHINRVKYRYDSRVVKRHRSKTTRPTAGV